MVEFALELEPELKPELELQLDASVSEFFLLEARAAFGRAASGCVTLAWVKLWCTLRISFPLDARIPRRVDHAERR